MATLATTTTNREPEPAIPSTRLARPCSMAGCSSISSSSMVVVEPSTDRLTDRSGAQIAARPIPVEHDERAENHNNEDQSTDHRKDPSDRGQTDDGGPDPDRPVQDYDAPVQSESIAATSAPTPRSAAKLKTFDPMTTPAPTDCRWLRRALTDEVISGVSAASAAIIPSSASVAPKRLATRSIRDTSSQLVARLTADPRRNVPRFSAGFNGLVGTGQLRSLGREQMLPPPSPRSHR